MPFWNFLKKYSKRPTRPPIKLCPQCQKPTLSHTKTAGWLSHETYYCTECGYMGAFYIEIDLDEAGDKMIDLNKLKKMFPEDVEPETEIATDAETLQAFQKKELEQLQKAPKKETVKKEPKSSS